MDNEDICMYCSSWFTSQHFMETHGEGAGGCLETGNITLYSHYCIFCDHKCSPKEEEQ
jgi:hypothetical protein